MVIEFEGVELDVDVFSFNDGELRYRTSFLYFDKNPEVAQRRDITFKVKNGTIFTYTSNLKREDDLISNLVEGLKNNYSHDIKKISLSSINDQQ